MADVAGFINRVAPVFVREGIQKRGFHIVSFAIAQACLESGYGTSADARNKNNLLGIGPHMSFSSWDACIEAYYTRTVLGKSDAAKNAATLDQYYQAFVASSYCPGTEAQYYSSVKSIINSNDLTKFDGGGGGVVAQTNKLEDFVKEAESHEGDTGSFVSSTLGFIDRGAWCAEFVWACAKRVGIEGVIIKGCAGAGETIDATLAAYGGTEHYDDLPGYIPQRGDLITYDWSGSKHRGHCSHIGIVTGFEQPRTILTIEGNTSGAAGGSCVSHKRRTYNNTVIRFLTPDWSKVGGFASGLVGDLYQNKNTREDAIIREVGYAVNNQLSTTASPTRLSVINYTDLFAAFWDAGKGLLGGGDSSQYDYGQIDPKARPILEFLVGKGLNNAAACGILGNIYYESSFNPGSIGDNGTSYGICQWHLSRRDAMIKVAGANWANNLTGQLDYLWIELNNSYSSVLSFLRGVDNSEAGAKSAADHFVRNFERPANVNNESIKRQAKAAEFFKQIVIIQTGDSGFNSVNLGNASQKRQTIVNAALSQQGVPYVWGGEHPKGSASPGLDCSGLTQYSYRQAGINIPHQSGSQLSVAPHRLSVSQAIPGDILWMSGHVAIFIGDGKVMHAYQGSPSNTYSNPGGPAGITEVWSSFTYALHWDI